MNDKTLLPSGVLALMEAQGIDTSELLFAVAGDMDEQMNYISAFAAVDRKGLYLVTCHEEMLRAKSGVYSRFKKGVPKSPEIQYTLASLRAIPLEEIDKLKTERYLSSGRLILEYKEEQEGLFYFSIGKMAAFEDFIKGFSAVKEGKDLEQVKKSFHESPFCPACGTRYPDSKRRVCPKCIDKRSTAKRLFAFFGGYKGKVAFIIGAMLFGSLLSMLAPQISTRVLYDEVLAPAIVESTPTVKLLASLGYVVLAILGMRILNLVFNIVYQYILGGFLPWVIYDIKVKIFDAMQRLSVGFYTSKQTGSLMGRVNEDSDRIYWFFIDGFPYTITNLLTLIGVVVAMFIMSWQLTLITIVLIPIVVVSFMVLDKFFRRMHHRNWVLRAKLSSVVSDNINGQRIIKAFSKEEEEATRFGEISGQVMRQQIHFDSTSYTVYPLLYLFVYAVTTMIIALGGVMVVQGKLSLGTLLTFSIYINMLHRPLDFLSWVSNWWARCVDAAQRIFEIIDTESDVIERENPVILPAVNGNIEISELEFEYEPARPVIKKLDLKVEAGQMLGIVGKTGAGKTTIANLIARLYDPKAGSIQIDGVDVRDLSLSQLRENIGLVSQEIYLFMGTIADNIRYAKPEATMDEVIAAAKAASAHDFIMRLPDGYETRVGAGGQGLSGGERQRLSIARTIIQNPKILILDEATASMDTETERNIQNALSRLQKGRTTIAIAHRLSTLRDADVLAVIEDGKVVEFGAYLELMRKKGEYFKLYQIQARALKYVGIGD